jgi:hypothetical protein
MDVKETGEEHVDWINLAHNMDNRWSLVNIATILRSSIKKRFPEQLRGCQAVSRESSVVVVLCLKGHTELVLCECVCVCDRQPVCSAHPVWRYLILNIPA